MPRLPVLPRGRVNHLAKVTRPSGDVHTRVVASGSCVSHRDDDPSTSTAAWGADGAPPMPRPGRSALPGAHSTPATSSQPGQVFRPGRGGSRRRPPRCAPATALQHVAEPMGPRPGPRRCTSSINARSTERASGCHPPIRSSCWRPMSRAPPPMVVIQVSAPPMKRRMVASELTRWTNSLPSPPGRHGILPSPAPGPRVIRPVPIVVIDLAEQLTARRLNSHLQHLAQGQRGVGLYHLDVSRRSGAPCRCRSWSRPPPRARGSSGVRAGQWHSLSARVSWSPQHRDHGADADPPPATMR